MSRRIIFRADGNAQIGSGHIMRCLSVAEAARRLGYSCWSVTAGNEMTEKIDEKGFEFLVLNCDYTCMEQELEDFERILTELNPDMIFIDSYYVTFNYLSRIREFAQTAYIDDLADFAYPVDFLINYSIYADETDYVSLYDKAGIMLPDILEGCGYVPLRAEFQSTGDRKQNSGRPQILMTTGSSDPYGIMLKMIEKIVSRGDFQAYDYHFIVGSLNIDYKDIFQKACLVKNVRIYSDVQRMRDVMMNCDIAVSAGGTTLYELCACGVPTITYIMADNQTMNAYTFEKKGIMLCAGDCRNSESFIDDLFAKIMLLGNNRELCDRLSFRAREAVDARGADNIINYIANKIQEGNLYVTV